MALKESWFRALLCLFVFAAAVEAQSRDSILKAISGTPAWTPSSAVAEYDEGTINTIAGRRANAINHYGLAGASVQDWMGPEGKVKLTLYEMIDTSAAYGLFTSERDSNQSGFARLAFGSESFRISNRTFIWQSKYLVKLEGNADATEALGQIVSQNIFGRSQKPPVSNLLPPENLVPDTDKYVLDPEGISPKLGLDPATLGFDDSVEVATADYRIDGKAAQLVLLLYPTQQVAKKYADQWDAEKPDESPFRKRTGPLIALLRGSRDVSVAESILKTTNYESQVTWNEPRPDISLRTVILTIFSFTGIALLFTLVAGLSFGGLRVYVKSRFPDRVFDRSADMEIIQLKLTEGLTRKELGE